MAQIIKHREHVTVVSYSLAFDYEGERNHGFAFDCNEAGVPFLKTEASRANYEACLTGKVGSYVVVARGVQRREHSYFEPAECRCACGEVVVLHSSWANSCEGCDREFNGSGQELAPRSQWGEETGEQF